MKKGQLTVFIIIGIIILFVIGTVVYITRTRVSGEFEAIRPRLADIPQEIQPVRDLVHTCMERLATDGLRKIGDQGGYITPLPYTSNNPTGNRAAEFSPGAGPIVAYWWHMKSDNTCEQNCEFASERPPLTRGQGSNSIESQLDKHIADNLASCLAGFTELQRTGCTVTAEDQPTVQTTVAAEDVFFTAHYPLRATCDGQTFSLDEFYVSLPLNFRSIYNLATNITNMEIQYQMFEMATKTIIETFSGENAERLPPTREFTIGPPSSSTFWVKYNVLQNLKALLVSYIPIIQASNTRNYDYITAPPTARDAELYENLYNRQFLIPLEDEDYTNIEAHFSYYDWWEPYFDLNCNGQLCQADSGSNFFLIPFSINRYTFAYDISYPVLAELRDPDAFNGEGYSFHFFIEQNMRDNEAFLADTELLQGFEAEAPGSIYCDPSQRTSGLVNLSVRDGKTLGTLDNGAVSYICGEDNCNMGFTADGAYSSRFPRCVGGILRLTKPGYATLSLQLDTFTDEPIAADVIMEPISTLQATVRNYPITKQNKYGGWGFMPGTAALTPKDTQSTVVVLERHTKIFEEPFSTVAEIRGTTPEELTIIPGTYTVSITSFLRDNLTIPADQRCERIPPKFGIGKSKKECFLVPQQPIFFNETSPFPYGSTEFEYTITPNMLRGKSAIEFKQFILAIDKISADQRIVEDLGAATQVANYAAANLPLLEPELT